LRLLSESELSFLARRRFFWVRSALWLTVEFLKRTISLKSLHVVPQMVYLTRLPRVLFFPRYFALLGPLFLIWRFWNVSPRHLDLPSPKPPSLPSDFPSLTIPVLCLIVAFTKKFSSSPSQEIFRVNSLSGISRRHSFPSSASRLPKVLIFSILSYGSL